MGDNPEAVAEMHLTSGCKDLTKRDAEVLLEIVRLLQARPLPDSASGKQTNEAKQ